MRSLIKELKKELLKYSKFNNDIQKLIDNKNNGYLLIKSNTNYIQYYKCKINSKTNKVERKYIPKSEVKLAEKLANNTFYNKISKILQERTTLLNKLIDNYEKKNIEEYYNNLIPERRQLINLIIPTWEQRLKEWKNEEYISSSYPFGSIEIYTKKGERVRSKSEKIFADILADFGVEYIYECPLYLENGEMCFPDFTIFSKYSDKKIYWEHFGMMDNPEYAINTIRKIENYTRNGIYYGHNLFFSFETSQNTFDIKNVENIIKKFF